MEPIEMIQIIKAEEVELDVTQTEVKLMPINGDYIWKMYKNPSLSDVTLIVEGIKLPAVRFVLSMHSSFFEELFNENVEDRKKKEFTLGKDIKLKPFETLLHFMYSGDLEFEPAEKLNEVVELLVAANFLGVHVAVHKIIHYIFNNFQKVEDIVELFNNSIALNVEILKDTAFFMIVMNQPKIFIKDVFTKFSEAAVFVLLDSDEWIIEEYVIFQLTANWLSVNTTTKQEELLKKIQLPRIDMKLLVKEIRQKKLFSDTTILDAIETKCESLFENYRNKMKVISLDDESLLDNGKTSKKYKMEPSIFKAEICLKDIECHRIYVSHETYGTYDLHNCYDDTFVHKEVWFWNDNSVTVDEFTKNKEVFKLLTYASFQEGRFIIKVYHFLLPKFLQNETL